MNGSDIAPIAILHVEDDPDIRTIVHLALSIDPGLCVRSAPSAAAALAMIGEGEGGWRPDLLLLDVMMPDMDGPSLYAEIRTRSKGQAIPVIFMTARSREADQKRYRAAGALGIIAKPFDPTTLGQQVRAMLETVR